MQDLSVERIVKMLDLAPHPEGGFYRETFRDPHRTAQGRSASTAIYFLLPAGVKSRWHKVDAAEIWHFHAGAPLDLLIQGPDGSRTSFRLGNDLASGERPQAVVPAHCWQAAISRGGAGGWTLAGCTVAPGFEFAAFEVIDGEPPRTA